MRLAKVENDIVTNIIVGQLADYPGYNDVTGIHVGIDWSFDGLTYTAPEQPVPETLVSIENVVFSGPGVDEMLPDGTIELLSNQNVNLSFDLNPVDAFANGTKLSIPVMNPKTQEEKYFRAVVTGGTIAIIMKLESGPWIVNSDLVNSVGRDGFEFSVNDINMRVIDS